jgi:hypothetical protein
MWEWCIGGRDVSPIGAFLAGSSGSGGGLKDELLGYG